jgi:Na+-translocating ferredoxin:NAD+ oxidoreductase RnfD subunit
MNERTPAGGDRSEITFTDATGKVLPDATGAVEAEIREYADNIMIARTYMAVPTPDQIPTWTPPGDVLAEPDVADAVKSTWNVWASDDGILRLVTTVDSLLDAMGLTNASVAEKRDFLLNLLKLPSWQAAPLELKQDVAHWIAQH